MFLSSRLRGLVRARRDEILSSMVTTRASIPAPTITSTVRPKERVTTVFGNVLLVNGVVSRIHHTLLPFCDLARHLQAITSVLYRCQLWVNCTREDSIKNVKCLQVHLRNVHIHSALHLWNTYQFRVLNFVVRNRVCKAMKLRDPLNSAPHPPKKRVLCIRAGVSGLLYKEIFPSDLKYSGHKRKFCRPQYAEFNSLKIQT